MFDKSFNINNYNIVRILLDHGNLKPAYGYIFDDSKIKVGFTGDTNFCDNVRYMANICNYLICDCNTLDGNNKHMGVNNYFRIA